MKTTRTIVQLLLIISIAASAATKNEEPVCTNPDVPCDPDDAPSSPTEEASSLHDCSLWLYDGWVLAGRDYERQKVIGFSQSEDVAVRFKQHDRRAWPLFGRFHYFHQIPDKPYEFVFVPSLQFPLECHTYLHNVQVDYTELFSNETNHSIPPLLTKQKVKRGDPVFLPCLEPELSADETVFNIPTPTDEELEMHGVCLDFIELRPTTSSSSNNNPKTTNMAVAKQPLEQGDVLTQGMALHLHRSELHNVTDDSDEELLNFCWGHEQTNLLLLPLVPYAHAIQPAINPDQVNIKVEWDMKEVYVRQVLNDQIPYRLSLGETEDPSLYLKYVATKDIAPGDELYIDFGSDWFKAWEEHLTQKPDAPFRRAMDFPLFPTDWLAKETRGADDFPAFETPPLAPGEIGPLTLTSGEVLTPHIHRIGLPQGLAAYIAEWAEDMGITDIMRSYLFERELEVEAEEHVRINGGNWWLKRFDNEWRSNLFYITPDDDEANEQFMHALGRAGWDQVLEAMGRKFGVKTLGNFYPSFIALTHSEFAFMHSDSDHTNIWNVIFPVVQSNATNSAGVPEAEINLGRDDGSPLQPLNVPYKYEPDHAVALGLDGMHGTAPGDYRGTGEFRMVASIYMGDFTDIEMLDEYVEAWNDPPYPRTEKLRAMLAARQHWHADDPNIHCGNPQLNDIM